MNFEIITDHNRLLEVCAIVSKKSYLMVDTEFVRTRTLYPKLGLIQIYDGEILALIDPIEIDDMSPFWQVLKDPDVTKVLHACGEDLEVFQHYAGCMPSPMLDTQIMASFLGYGMSAGFASLVKDFLDVELDKGESRTDWLARPLTSKQQDYAAADVYYLLPMFELIKQQVIDAGWWSAVEQETTLIMSKRQSVKNPDKAYLDIKNAWQLQPNQLAQLRILAKWRLEEARKRDLALNFVVKELSLWKMARYDIRSKDQMLKEEFDFREVQRHGNKLMNLMLEADQVNQSDYPDKISRLVDFPQYKQIFKQLKDQVKVVSEECGLATEFLASKKQLNQFLSSQWKHPEGTSGTPDVLSGWRKALLQQKLSAVIE
ncbi:ribonuclease D [Aliivibrio kagoshimensis]|uniref:ribonuclease D n=1 Tax=Aliivibrio kagoshimensis TaxID=2910230 RepID=UPI003D11232F